MEYQTIFINISKPIGCMKTILPMDTTSKTALRQSLYVGNTKKHQNQMHPNRIEEQTIFMNISKPIGRMKKILPMDTKSKSALHQSLYVGNTNKHQNQMHPNRIEKQTIFLNISKTIGRINKILPMEIN